MRDARLLAVVTPSKQLPTDALRSPRAFGSRPSRPIRCGVVRVLDLPLLVVKTMESSGGRHDVRFDGVGRAALLGEHEPCPDEVALGTDEAGRPEASTALLTASASSAVMGVVPIVRASSRPRRRPS